MQVLTLKVVMRFVPRVKPALIQKWAPQHAPHVKSVHTAFQGLVPVLLAKPEHKPLPEHRPVLLVKQERREQELVPPVKQEHFPPQDKRLVHLVHLVKFHLTMLKLARPVQLERFLTQLPTPVKIVQLELIRPLQEWQLVRLVLPELIMI